MTSVMTGFLRGLFGKTVVRRKDSTEVRVREQAIIDACWVVGATTVALAGLWSIPYEGRGWVAWTVILIWTVVWLWWAYQVGVRVRSLADLIQRESQESHDD